MAKLGTRTRPAIVRVQTREEANSIVSDCAKRGWIVIAGVEPDKTPDTRDYHQLLELADDLTHAGLGDVCTVDLEARAGKLPVAPARFPTPCIARGGEPGTRLASHATETTGVYSLAKEH